MRKPFIQLLLLFVFTTAFLSGCSEEIYQNEIVQNSKRITSEKITLNQLNSELSNPTLKSYIKNELKNHVGISEFRTNPEEYFNFLKIIKEGEYITYSLTINKYTEEKPYFLNFVITKDGTIEKAGFTKYIPNEPILELDPDNFDGKLQVLDIEENLAGERQFLNSTPVEVESISCYNSYSIVTHNCSNGGNHPPNVPCGDGYVNDGYYEVVTTTICTWNANIQYLAPPNSFLGSGGGGDTGIFTPNVNVLLFLSQLERDFLDHYLILKDNPELVTYLEDNDASQESKDFVMELANFSLEFENDGYEKTEINEMINVVTYAKINNYENINLNNDFYSTVDEKSSVAFNDPIQAINFARLYIAHCAIIKKQNPTWPYWKVFGRAWLDTTHLVLDLGGTVPAFGEVCDLANGVIYTIEGDTTNATLSFAATIPIGGWFFTGAKFAVRADGLKYVVVGANNLISFGAYNSKKFRSLLGLLPGDPRQAHHLIPCDFANNTIVQKAAKASTNEGFHMHSTLNGIPMPTTNHLTGHNLYSAKINQILNTLDQTNPNMSPNTAFNHIQALTNQIKNHITNHPNYNLGQISSLIVYP